jgi:hypothetical protein
MPFSAQFADVSVGKVFPGKPWTQRRKALRPECPLVLPGPQEGRTRSRTHRSAIDKPVRHSCRRNPIASHATARCTAGGGQHNRAAWPKPFNPVLPREWRIGILHLAADWCFRRNSVGNVRRAATRLICIERLEAVDDHANTLVVIVLPRVHVVPDDRFPCRI